MTPLVENLTEVPKTADEPGLAPPKGAGLGGPWMATLQSLCGTIVIAIFVITFVAQAFQIPSESMEQTLLIGDYLLVDKVQFSPPGSLPWVLPYSRVERGDIIVFKWPVQPQQHFVKRVIGVPGDRLRLTAGRVYVNSHLLDESYALYKQKPADPFRDNFPSTHFISQQVTPDWWGEFPKITRNGDLLVPEGHYFVLGDNRNESLDSRYWGLVPEENIVGRPLLIYFSVRPPPRVMEGAAPDARIKHLTAWLWQIPGMARWGRAFHLVK